MKALPIQKTVFDFAALTTQNGGNASTEQDLSFQMMLESALNPGLPEGAESSERPGKTPEKKTTRPEETKAEPEAKADGQAAAPQQPVEPDSSDAGEQNQVAATEVPSQTAVPFPIQTAGETATAVVPETSQVLPEADAQVLAADLPTGDIVSAEAIFPQEDTQSLFAPELLETMRPSQADTVQAQESFDHLVAKSTEALTPKDLPVTEIPSDPPEAPASESLTHETTQMSGSALQREAVTAQPIKVTRGQAEEENTDDPLLATLHIPAGETAKTAPVSAPEKAQESTPAQQIETQIVQHLEQEKMEFRMQLNPQSLGKIDVKMVLEGGKLTVEILAANAKTAELLSRQAQSLAASLRVNSAQLQSVQVVTETQSESGHMQQSLNMMMGGSYQGGSENAEAGGGAASNSATTSTAGQPEQTGQTESDLGPKQMLDTSV